MIVATAVPDILKNIKKRRTFKECQVPGAKDQWPEKGNQLYLCFFIALFILPITLVYASVNEVLMNKLFIGMLTFS